MARKDTDELEQPLLDLHVEGKKPLPETIPDIFDEAETEAVLQHDQDIRLRSLLDDLHVFLKIGDVTSAKEEYKKLLDLFNRLPPARKKEYFDRVNEAYDAIKHPKDVQRAFKKSLSR